MAKGLSGTGIVPRLPRGLVAYTEEDLQLRALLLGRIRKVYSLYGFEQLETPILEYRSMLGDFLPDRDRPNAGRFSFQEEDGQWLSLRYDLTAPLARYVAENFDSLPKPYRSYRVGEVFRDEKPGPGRFRQFLQFDADTVGSAEIAADAEMCMMAADCMEALSFARGESLVRVNSRKLLDAIMDIAELDPSPETGCRLTVLRAVDKLDRLGAEGVRALLGSGRLDESGDFTQGAGLSGQQIDVVFGLLEARKGDRGSTLAALESLVGSSAVGQEALKELQELSDLLTAAGYAEDRVRIDPSIVRGLEYYTGLVYELGLDLCATGSSGDSFCFGSVGGGGRYDGLIGRFRKEPVPATGFSVGISRLLESMKALGRFENIGRKGPVVVLVLNRDYLEFCQRMVQDLREAGVRSELYLGSGGVRAQMKYADRRNAPLVVLYGEDEHARAEVTIKDLEEGTHLSKVLSDNQEWRAGRPAQFSVPQGDLVRSVQERLQGEKGSC